MILMTANLVDFADKMHFFSLCVFFNRLCLKQKLFFKKITLKQSRNVITFSESL